MDADTKAVLLELCQLCQGTLESASQARLIALRVHEAHINAQVPVILMPMNLARRDSPDLKISDANSKV